MIGKLTRWLPQKGMKTLQICLGCISIGIWAGTEYNPYLWNHTHAHNVHSGGEWTPARPVYEITGTYEPKQRDLKGHMQLHVPENLPEAQGNSVFLHLYPNAFHHWKHEKFIRPVKPGFLIPYNVKINGQNAVTELHHNKTILQIHLPRQTKETTLNIEMDYHLRIPEGGLRLSQEGKTAFLAQWYPMLAVHDQNRWHLNPYTTIGEPFYTRAADYHVSLETPPGYRIISTGRNPEPSKNTARISSHQTRDFTAMITSEYQALTSQEDGVYIHLWYRPEDRELAQSLQHTAVSSLRFFSEKFGAYRDEITDELDIVFDSSKINPGNMGGMEYPGLITIQTRGISRMRREIPIPDNAIKTPLAHEIAHQWWYGFVGNNQAQEAWLDEGLTTFSEILYMENVEGETHLDDLRKIVSSSDKSEIGKKETLTGDPHSKESYGIMAYARPAAMMFDLATEVGNMDELLAILNKYHNQYRYKIATGCEFIRFVESQSRKNLRYFFYKWLYRLPDDCLSENEKPVTK
ncbi:M1 family metallopeptidase [Pasteuria penetrans]|uniref:M1 family metallopeptidase n=1 Tax=Pasteuria penetrans TaxID=86005 RepID=UPI000FAD6C2E|nr:M1 family metallopeptidase [Pasteuria penetrans]